MAPPSCCLSLATTFFTVFVLLPVATPAAPTQVKQRLLQRPADGTVKRGFLQAEGGEVGAAGAEGDAKKRPAMDIPFFSEDADRMAEMPPYRKDTEARTSLPGNPVCNPRCQYTCGHKECDQTCEPLCLPPKCETLCMKSADKCETRCAKPKCAVICPTTDCLNGDCPKCRTICSQPACTTSCGGSCHSVCTQPQCSWKCKVGSCPKPDCKMTCSGFTQCHENLPSGVPQAASQKLPLMPGMDIKSQANASLDPKVLLKPAKPPPPEALKNTMSKPHMSIGHRQVEKIMSTTISPVEKLKMRWQAEDLVADNARIFER